MRRRGFTLVELLIYMAIFSAVVIGFITIFIAITRLQSRQSSANEVQTQGQFLLQQIQYYAQSARLVDMTQDAATSTLTLRESAASSSIDPTVLSLASGTVYLTQGAGSPQALTSNEVTVSNLSFTRHFNLNNSSTPYGTDSVSFSFTMAASTTNQTQYYSQSFQSSVAVLAPVPKIALVQQAGTALAGTGYTTVSSTYGSPNETSSLLIAVVSNASSSAANVSVSDSAGNTWTKVANPAYAAYNEEMTIFAATNAKNAANTVTATTSIAVSNLTLFIYEYRGAATSSSFDASSTAVTTSTYTPASGSANATSAVELLFGALYYNPSTGSLTPGAGFTLETSSTVSATAVEDEDTYVTGAVSAGWNYQGTSPPTTSSSAAIVTFK